MARVIDLAVIALLAGAVLSLEASHRVSVVARDAPVLAALKEPCSPPSYGEAKLMVLEGGFVSGLRPQQVAARRAAMADCPASPAIP